MGQVRPSLASVALLTRCSLLKFVQELPDGFETELGGKGKVHSCRAVRGAFLPYLEALLTARRQRIALARAVLWPLRNPKILLLDEGAYIPGGSSSADLAQPPRRSTQKAKGSHSNR